MVYGRKAEVVEEAAAAFFLRHMCLPFDLEQRTAASLSTHITFPVLWSIHKDEADSYKWEGKHVATNFSPPILSSQATAYWRSRSVTNVCRY